MSREPERARFDAAPTLIGLALPAVTVPPSGMKTGFNALRASRLVSQRMH